VACKAIDCDAYAFVYKAAPDVPSIFANDYATPMRNFGKYAEL